MPLGHYKDKSPKRFYYDVTSSYVEGDYSDSELVKYGYNRDKKSGKAQIVTGLLTDGDGHGKDLLHLCLFHYKLHYNH